MSKFLRLSANLAFPKFSSFLSFLSPLQLRPSHSLIVKLPPEWEVFFFNPNSSPGARHQQHSSHASLLLAVVHTLLPLPHPFLATQTSPSHRPSSLGCWRRPSSPGASPPVPRESSPREPDPLGEISASSLWLSFNPILKPLPLP